MSHTKTQSIFPQATVLYPKILQVFALHKCPSFYQLNCGGRYENIQSHLCFTAGFVTDTVQ